MHLGISRVAFCSIPLRAVEFPVQYVLEDASRNGGIVPGNYNALIPPNSSGMYMNSDGIAANGRL